MARRKILQSSTKDSEKIVATVLVKLVVFHRDNSVYEIAWYLLVRNRLPVLDINLAKNFVITINNDAGRFHLFELRKVKHGSFIFERSDQIKNGETQPDEKNQGCANRQIEDRSGKPTAVEIINRGRREIGDWHMSRALRSYYIQQCHNADNAGSLTMYSF